MRPPIRLAALMELPVITVFTHDSIALGEDGPTHQPVEQLAGLRAVPGLLVLRPCDANETAVAWRVAIESRGRPVALLLSRQAVPTLDRTRLAGAEGLRRGAYVLADAPGMSPDVILIATGTELALAVTAYEQPPADGLNARVVSMPSWELFDRQDQASGLQVPLGFGVFGRFGPPIGFEPVPPVSACRRLEWRSRWRPSLTAIDESCARIRRGPTPWHLRASESACTPGLRRVCRSSG
jgi:hypothetical protein